MNVWEELECVHDALTSRGQDVDILTDAIRDPRNSHVARRAPKCVVFLVYRVQ
jgi:hypothetical protein